MIQAKGMAAHTSKAPLKPYSFERRDPKDHDVVIDIKYCGICHSDIHMVRDEWGPGQFPMVPGHEIAGVVRAVGPKVTKYKVGDHVGVGCLVDSCAECAHCKQDLEQYCMDGQTLTYGSMERDGSGITQGGYSDVIVVKESFVVRIPDSLPLDKAAPLLCAGITLYSPLAHWKAGPGKKVAIMGLGGLGHMGVKLAKAMGAEVTVLSHSESKQDDTLKLGADRFILTKNADAFKDNALYFDLIINTVSSADLEMANYFSLLKLDGTLVSVGAPDKPLSVNVFPLILMRRSFAGSAIGGIKETQEMLDFCGKHNITPEIELISPEQVNVAYERVLKSDVRYRFVLDMGKI
ncbi:NAD(P)-dependent alcohol dehydrogenase [Bdellovibrio bacteriovorus]|uniref:NADP-dependent alcohol dehydrogenase n=1 Tax=Bdellovibrio bacteriovorus str. Tiberius TaxID=1069642 RepID=K7YSG2_BDEBC|nr:NAD(P)-dependent alcohol dehydrogenase [Bdellovibrio bacteriovorus]AFY00563.1 NADP-dependent alcohol dehydrogenase [Bdellovibrio bacteriovorus str. Tiberius]